jgi:hypothetical protein
MPVTFETRNAASSSPRLCGNARKMSVNTDSKVLLSEVITQALALGTAKDVGGFVTAIKQRTMQSWALTDDGHCMRHKPHGGFGGHKFAAATADAQTVGTTDGDAVG